MGPVAILGIDVFRRIMSGMGESEHSRNEQESIGNEIRFEGGTPAEKRQVLDLCTATRLPLDNVRTIRIVEDEKSKKADTETFDAATYEPRYKRLTIYRRMLNRNDLPETVIHELAHASSPFETGNDRLYGGHEQRLEMGKMIIKIAKSLLAADRALNTYHAKLTRKYKLNPFRHPIQSLPKEVLYEETWAILVELRFTDPSQLTYIQRSLQELQEEKIISLKKPPQLISEEHSSAPKGVDKALLALMPDSSMDDLRALLARFVAPPRSRYSRY